MRDVSLVTVSWNQPNCLELLLKSYIKHHYTGRHPMKLVLVDNNSDEQTTSWLDENEVPYEKLSSNVGHENALNHVFARITTPYIVINDTDIEYTNSFFPYYVMIKSGIVGSVGEIVENWFEQTRLVDRISPWFMMLNLRELKMRGVQYFRDPENTDWTFDVGSWITQKMKELGMENMNIERQPGNQDQDLVSMTYDYFRHWGKVSWNLDDHMDRFDEVIRRREAILHRLKEYDDIDLRGKFISGL